MLLAPSLKAGRIRSAFLHRGDPVKRISSVLAVLALVSNFAFSSLQIEVRFAIFPSK